jgi:hypothetical protein
MARCRPAAADSAAASQWSWKLMYSGGCRAERLTVFHMECAYTHRAVPCVRVGPKPDSLRPAAVELRLELDSPAKGECPPLPSGGEERKKGKRKICRGGGDVPVKVFRSPARARSRGQGCGGGRGAEGWGGGGGKGGTDPDD